MHCTLEKSTLQPKLLGILPEHVRVYLPLLKRQFKCKVLSLSSFVVVVCHFQTSTLESTLDIKAFIGLRAVENSLYDNNQYADQNVSDACQNQPCSSQPSQRHGPRLG